METDPSTSNVPTFKFKIVLLGEGAVGKTSLMLRYVENKFNPQHVSTLQASFLCKKMLVDGQKVDLNIWDTAGQEKFHALGPIYYRDSHGALLIYDITDVHSFAKVKMWVKELRRMLGDCVSLIIVGNKIDLDRNRNVDVDEAKEYAKSIGADHFETSAKENIGITIVFDHLVKFHLIGSPPDAVGGSGIWKSRFEIYSRLVERAKQLQLENIDVSQFGTAGCRDLLIVDDPPAPRKSCCTG